jgi:hypothetical protein
MTKNFSHPRWADNVYAPDTDLDNVRNRVAGILLGLVVTAFSSITSGPSAKPNESSFRVRREVG